MSEASVFSAGDVLEGRYRIVRLLGQGGAGEVYEARDVGTGERLALKTVVRDQVHSTKAMGRFRREMELSQRISHRNVLRIFELLEVPVEVPEESRTSFGGTAPGGGATTVVVPCMMMEYLDGETLADRLERGETLSTEEAEPIVCQMARGLAAAHDRGIVHRDLKPDNIFLVPGDDGVRVVLTDFGVARRTVPSHHDATLTSSNVILGTPRYMAPEQLELEKAMPASDVYALGLVTFEMLTGRRPFEAETEIKMVFKRVEEDPPSPREYLPDLERRWEETILRCLARKPEDRFVNPREIIRALSSDDSNGSRRDRSAERRKLLWAAALWVLALVLATAVLWTIF